MELGDWQSQLYDKIVNSDVFIPLVSPDYAESSTFGLKEFERAKNVAVRKRWTDFFAPIILGEPISKAGQKLRNLDGFNAGSVDDISAENRNLDHWLGRVVSAGLGRDTV